MTWGLGLVGSSPDDIVGARFIAWDTQCISPFAKLVAVHLSEFACPVSGEIIIDYQRVKDACICLSDDDELHDLLDAVGELVGIGVLNYARITGGFLYAGFDVDDSSYYGDDTNAPPDLRGSVCLVGEEWVYEPESEEALEEAPVYDQNPRRHRIFLKTDYRCFYCSKAWAQHLDHMHPQIRGGGDEDENMIGACRTCNIQKKDRTVEEYRAWLSHKRRLSSITLVRFYGEATVQ